MKELSALSERVNHIRSQRLKEEMHKSQIKFAKETYGQERTSHQEPTQRELRHSE
jgi:hypothetical protein